VQHCVLTPVDPRSSASRSRLALHSFFEACIGSSKHALATGSSRPFYRNRESPLIKRLRRVRAIRSNSSHPRVRKQVAQQPTCKDRFWTPITNSVPTQLDHCMPNDRAGAKRSWRCGCQISLPPALDLVRTSAWTRPTCTAGTNPTAWGNDSRSQNGELHAPSLNFGRAARQSTSVLISLGLPHAPSFLRASAQFPPFTIAKFAVNVCSPDTKNISKSVGRDRMRTNGDEHRCTRKGLFFKGFRT